jgi:hypothetical protein
MASEELTNLLNRARELHAGLENKHKDMIISAARERFVQRVAECEIEIVRHERFLESHPKVPVGHYLTFERSDKLNEARAAHAECLQIIEYLDALSVASRRAVVEELALDVADSGFFR